jgi:hypothetical protein
MNRKLTGRRRKEISPVVMKALLYPRPPVPASDTEAFPPPTMEQIELVLSMTDDERIQYFKVGRALLESQRRRERQAKPNRGRL